MIKFDKNEFLKPQIYSTLDEYETRCNVTKEIVEEIEQLQQERDKYKEVIEEVKRVLRCNNIEVLKYYDEPSETGSYEIVTVDLLQILDKAKDN